MAAEHAAANLRCARPSIFKYTCLESLACTTYPDLNLVCVHLGGFTNSIHALPMKRERKQRERVWTTLGRMYDERGVLLTGVR